MHRVIEDDNNGYAQSGLNIFQSSALYSHAA